MTPESPQAPEEEDLPLLDILLAFIVRGLVVVGILGGIISLVIWAISTFSTP